MRGERPRKKPGPASGESRTERLGRGCPSCPFTRASKTGRPVGVEPPKALEGRESAPHVGDHGVPDGEADRAVDRAEMTYAPVTFFLRTKV